MSRNKTLFVALPVAYMYLGRVAGEFEVFRVEGASFGYTKSGPPHSQDEVRCYFGLIGGKLY